MTDHDIQEAIAKGFADVAVLLARVERLERAVAEIECNSAPGPGSALHGLREAVKTHGLPVGDPHRPTSGLG